jgi:hypothetical protein
MPAAEPKNSPRLSAAFPPPTIDGGSTSTPALAQLDSP